MIKTYLYKNKTTIKLIFLLLIILLIIILTKMGVFKLLNKENFVMVPSDSSMTYYELKNPEIIDNTINELKDSMFERNKYWSFITPKQEFNGNIPKIQDVTNTKINKNNIYYKSEESLKFENEIEGLKVLRLIGSIRIKYKGKILENEDDINTFLENININFTPGNIINGNNISEQKNEIQFSKSVKLQKPTYYIFKNEKLNKINEGSTLAPTNEILIIFNDNINLHINTPNISLDNPDVSINRINYIEVYGEDLNSITNRLRYIDNISIILTKIIFVNMTSQLLCFGNSGTVGNTNCEFDDTNLTQIDSQSRIWIDSFIDEEIFNSDGQSLNDIKINLKNLIDEKDSEYFDYLSDLLDKFRQL